VKGKWAKGIAPRFFAWIIKDKLAVSERPGGYSRNHRPVRRQEEILWLRGEGFTRVVSLLQSPHNLHAYDKLELTWAHIPFGPHDDPQLVLPDLYGQLRDWMNAGERLLVHQEELSDRLMGVVAGYLRWSGLVPAGPQAISVVERILHRQMGPEGRMLVAAAPDLAGASCRNGTDPAAHADPDGPADPDRHVVVASPADPRETAGDAPAERAAPVAYEVATEGPTEVPSEGPTDLPAVEEALRADSEPNPS
jgi:hypothetical protein